MNNKDYLKLAVEQAKISVEKGGFPAGAVVVKDGKVLAEGVSLGRKLNDPTEHAETSAIRKACKNIGSYVDGATLYASLQPCLMCFSVANWSGVSKIVFGCKKTLDMVKKNYYEGTTEVEEVNTKNNRKIEIVYISGFEDEMNNLISKWEKQYEDKQD